MDRYEIVAGCRDFPFVRAPSRYFGQVLRGQFRVRPGGQASRSAARFDAGASAPMTTSAFVSATSAMPRNMRRGTLLLTVNMRRGTLLLTVDGLRPGLFGNAAEILRRARSVPAAGDVIYHVLSRGNCRMGVFQKPGDFAAFVAIIEEGRQRVRMRIVAYCLMSDHWHITGQDAPRLAVVESRRRRRSTSSRLRRRGRRSVCNCGQRKGSSDCSRASGAAGHSPGDAGVRRTAPRLGLEPTLRDPRRPKKPSPAAKETDSRRY
jgi:REP element-mobilizing transposase RayT